MRAHVALWWRARACRFVARGAATWKESLHMAMFPRCRLLVVVLLICIYDAMHGRTWMGSREKWGTQMNQGAVNGGVKIPDVRNRLQHAPAKRVRGCAFLSWRSPFAAALVQTSWMFACARSVGAPACLQHVQRRHHHPRSVDPSRAVHKHPCLLKTEACG